MRASISRRSVCPRLENLINRCFGRAIPDDGNQSARFKTPYCILHRRFRDSGFCRNRLKAGAESCPPAPFRLPPKPQIYQKGARHPVVADQIAHQNIDDVGFERDSCHATVAIAMIVRLEESAVSVLEERERQSGAGEASMIKALKFAGIPTSDQDRAVKFWTEKIGFRVQTDQPMGKQRWIELSIANSQTGLVLFTPEGHEDRIGSFFNGSFLCDDVEATWRQLSAKDVEFVKPPTKESWGTFAIFKDPDGNQFVMGSG